MTVTTGHFTLTPEQKAFKQMLTACPFLQPYWDFGKRECDADALENAMGMFSHGEQIMARFFMVVWFGKNQWSFDFIDAARTLDDEHRQVILAWFAAPIFP